MSIIDISKTDIEVIDTAYDGTSAFGIFMNGDLKGEWSAKIIGGEIRLEYNSTADGAVGNDLEMDAIGDDLVDTLYDDVCHLVRTEINQYRIFCMTMDLG